MFQGRVIPLLCFGLAVLLAPGQAADDVYAGQGVKALRIVVLQGEGRFNDAKARSPQTLEIMLKDEHDRPVAGARVTFAAPMLGPGGEFPNGQPTLTTTTGPDGKALAAGFRPNREEGRFNIRVVARHQGREATAVIAQSNTMATRSVEKPGGRNRMLVILGLAGGAASGLIVALSRSGSDSGARPPVQPPTSLSIGAVTVGGPR